MKHAKYNYEKTLAAKNRCKNLLEVCAVKIRSETCVSKLQMENGALSTNDQETANIPNNYFTTVFEREHCGPLHIFHDRNYQEVLENTKVTESKVDKAINALKSSKSQGQDNFHPKYLKENKDQLKAPLKYIFEKYLNEGALQEVWKQANVSAIFKQGD